jgi:hypothetical protein
MSVTEGINTTELITDADIASALDTVRKRISALMRDRDVLDRTVALAREEERLWERMQLLRGGNLPIAAPASESAGPSTDALPSAGHPAVQAVVLELEAAGRPLHISDLMRLLKQKGVAIPGSGMQANLIAHLRRDKRVIRPSRGIYGLAAWGLESMPTPRRSRRRKRRVRSVARDQGRSNS